MAGPILADVIPKQIMKWLMLIDPREPRNLLLCISKSTDLTVRVAFPTSYSYSRARLVKVLQGFRISIAKDGMGCRYIHLCQELGFRAFSRWECFKRGLFLSQISNSAYRIILECPHVEILGRLTVALLIHLNPLVFNLLVPTFAFKYIVRDYTCIE